MLKRRWEDTMYNVSYKIGFRYGNDIRLKSHFEGGNGPPGSTMHELVIHLEMQC